MIWVQIDWVGLVLLILWFPSPKPAVDDRLMAQRHPSIWPNGHIGTCSTFLHQPEVSPQTQPRQRNGSMPPETWNDESWGFARASPFEKDSKRIEPTEKMTAFGGRFDPNLSRMIILKCTRVINVNGWCPLGLIVLTFGYDRYLPNVPNRSSVHVRLFSMNGSVGYGALEGLEPRAADKWDACSCYEHCWTVAYCTFAINNH